MPGICFHEELVLRCDTCDASKSHRRSCTRLWVLAIVPLLTGFAATALRSGPLGAALGVALGIGVAALWRRHERRLPFACTSCERGVVHLVSPV